MMKDGHFCLVNSLKVELNVQDKVLEIKLITRVEAGGWFKGYLEYTVNVQIFVVTIFRGLNFHGD